VFGSSEKWDWKYLCQVLGLNSIPKSITQARKVVDSLLNAGEWCRILRALPRTKLAAY